MSRFVDVRDMSREEIIDTSYQVLALLRLCMLASRSIHDGDYDRAMAGDIAMVIELVNDLAGIVHDSIERKP